MTPRTRTDSAPADDLYAESRARLARPLDAAERLTSAGLGGAFLFAAIGVALLTHSQRSPSLVVVAVLVIAFATLANVEFEVGAGSAIPTQLMFVPMLFLLPLGWVPLAVAAGYWISLNADVVRGRRHQRARARAPVLVLVRVRPGRLCCSSGARALPAGACGRCTSPRSRPSSAPTSRSTLLRERRALGISLRRLVPMAAIAYGVDLALAPLGLLAAFAAIGMSYAFVLLLPVAVLLTIFARERKQRLEQEEELNVAYRRTMLLLGDVIEADDAYTGSHSRSVVDLVSGVAEVLQLSAAERTQAEFTALLHDVGKIRIPKAIIQKPEPLTTEERRLIQTHTIEGELILTQVGGSLAAVGKIVRSCHEWYDGNGYPDRLAGTAIPLIARIVCCCDAWSAMTTDRPYRAALTTEAAIVELRACSGSQFDPRVVDALIAVPEGRRRVRGRAGPGRLSAALRPVVARAPERARGDVEERDRGVDHQARVGAHERDQRAGQVQERPRQEAAGDARTPRAGRRPAVEQPAADRVVPDRVEEQRHRHHDAAVGDRGGGGVRAAGVVRDERGRIRAPPRPSSAGTRSGTGARGRTAPGGAAGCGGSPR